MNKVILDAETVAKLHGLTGPLDLCDEQGQVLGHFVPYPVGLAPSDLELDIPLDELRERADHFQGRPLSDLVAQWEKRK